MYEPINDAQQPLVSCIIIFLDAGDTFFIAAIESILSQTYSNWELLLVDDGSTDQSTSIALQYAQNDADRVRYLEHENHQNLGMSAARNLGISQTKGEFIALLDADDIWLPEKLERQVAILATYPEAAMVYGSTLRWCSWTGIAEDDRRDSQRPLGIKPNILVQPPMLIKIFLQSTDNTPATCAALIRSEIIRNVGGFEPSFRGMFEDQAFFYKVCLQAPVFIESGCWDKYRQHSDSTCHKQSVEQLQAAHVVFLTWLEQYFFQQGVKDVEVWQAFNQTIWPYRYKRRHYLQQLYRRVSQYFRKNIRNLMKPELGNSV
jgi:glycosyltransferase involved in cell wall biosynthesis